MSVFGLGNKVEAKKPEPAKAGAKSVQSDEAKKILAKMAAKKDAGDCPFC
jgi:hypothetical protein